MTTMTKRLRVSADGNLTIPLGREEAGAEVVVTVRSATPPEPSLAETGGRTTEERRESLRRLAGSIDDPAFRRYPQDEEDARLPFD